MGRSLSMPGRTGRGEPERDAVCASGAGHARGTTAVLRRLVGSPLAPSLAAVRCLHIMKFMTTLAVGVLAPSPYTRTGGEKQSRRQGSTARCSSNRLQSRPHSMTTTTRDTSALFCAAGGRASARVSRMPVSSSGRALCSFTHVGAGMSNSVCSTRSWMSETVMLLPGLRSSSVAAPASTRSQSQSGRGQALPPRTSCNSSLGPGGSWSSSAV